MADFAFIQVAGLVFVAGLALALVALRVAGVRPTQILDKREWVLLGKCVAILVMSDLLLLRLINADLPPEMFIYGRF